MQEISCLEHHYFLLLKSDKINPHPELDSYLEKCIRLHVFVLVTLVLAQVD